MSIEASPAQIDVTSIDEAAWACCTPASTQGRYITGTSMPSVVVRSASTPVNHSPFTVVPVTGSENDILMRVCSRPRRSVRAVNTGGAPSVAVAEVPAASASPFVVSISPVPVYSMYGVFAVSPICASSASRASVTVRSVAENVADDTVMSSAALFVAPSLPSGSTIQLDAESAVVEPANWTALLSVTVIESSAVVAAVNARAAAGTSTA